MCAKVLLNEQLQQRNNRRREKLQQVHSNKLENQNVKSFTFYLKEYNKKSLYIK